MARNGQIRFYKVAMGFVTNDAQKGSFRTFRTNLLYLSTMPAALSVDMTQPTEKGATKMPPLSSLAAPPDSLQPRRESHRLSSSNASLGPQMLSYATEAGPTACVSGMNHSEIPLSLFLNGAHFGMVAGKR